MSKSPSFEGVGDGKFIGRAVFLSSDQMGTEWQFAIGRISLCPTP